MKNNPWTIVVIITASLLLSISCGGSLTAQRQDAILGGCFGKTVILELAVTYEK